jgi:hypothetical protein
VQSFAAGLVQQVKLVGRVGGKYTPGPFGATASPNSAPAPGGLPDVPSAVTATCFPPGVVSTMFPSPPLTVSTLSFGAMARPSGPFSSPPALTAVPFPAESSRKMAFGMAAILLFTVSAT